MERQTFLERLDAAASRALSFARQFVLENLSDELVFRVRLNESHDSNLRSDQNVYPEDSAPERAHELHRCNEEEVIRELWRDGAVPEWVDVAVVGQTETESIVELRCCGRFTADDSRLYHQQAGIPPFSVHGPVLPPQYKSGDLFSIWSRLDVWGLDEMQLSLPHIHKVWSLTLLGSQFDDITLGELPTLPNTEIIELKQSPIRGDGLRSLTRHPKLRVLRIDLANPEGFVLKDPVLPTGLEHLGIEHLPTTPCGLEQLLERLPKLRWLSLASEGTVPFSGSILGKPDFLTISAENVVGTPRLPTEVGHLVLHLSKAVPSDIARLLCYVKKVRALTLSQTQVDDELAEELVCRLRPEYVSFDRTKVSDECLRGLKEAYPSTRIVPAAPEVTR